MKQPKKITAQEARISESDRKQIGISEFAKELLEQVSFVARDSEYVDAKSGVSARLSISAMENLMASANLRLIESNSVAHQHSVDRFHVYYPINYR